MLVVETSPDAGNGKPDVAGPPGIHQLLISWDSGELVKDGGVLEELSGVGDPVEPVALAMDGQAGEGGQLPLLPVAASVAAPAAVAVDVGVVAPADVVAARGAGGLHPGAPQPALPCLGVSHGGHDDLGNLGVGRGRRLVVKANSHPCIVTPF